jgi:hypothetical protein
LSDRELKILDNRLDNIAASLDPVLREVLLYPFFYQAVQFFERLVAGEDFSRLAHLAAVIPFLFSQAAGSQAEFLKNRFQHLSGEIATISEAIACLKNALPRPEKLKITVNQEEFKFSLSPPAATPEQTLAALNKRLLLAHIWDGGQTDQGKHRR